MALLSRPLRSSEVGARSRIDLMDGAGTAEVADEFDYKQPNAYRRLKALEDESRIRSRRISGWMFWQVVAADGDER